VTVRGRVPAASTARRTATGGPAAG